MKKWNEILILVLSIAALTITLIDFKRHWLSYVVISCSIISIIGITIEYLYEHHKKRGRDKH